MSDEKVLYCTFCGKSQDDVGCMLNSKVANVNLCNECVEQAMLIVLNTKYSKNGYSEVVDNNKDA